MALRCALSNAHLLYLLGGATTPLFVFCVELIVARPCFPAPEDGSEGGVLGAATVLPPCLPHILNAFLYVWLLPAHNFAGGLCLLREVLGSNVAYNCGYASSLGDGVNAGQCLVHFQSELGNLRVCAGISSLG